jgi:deazaflavin-dependent oxidoreductase (nitroreductase family)
MAKGPWGKMTSRAGAPKPGSPLFGAWKLVTRLNVKIWRLSGGRLLGQFDTAPMCVLHHRGRKSGEPRETPLVYLADGEDVVIVGSMGGSPKMPAWVHNLRADPAVEVELRGSRRKVRASEVDGPERERLWLRLLEVWPAWADYQRKTDRTFPVFRLSPR